MKNFTWTHKVRGYAAGGFALAVMMAGANPVSAMEITAEAAYTGEVWRNVSGGVTQGTRYLDNVDLALTGEFQAFGADATIYIHGIHNNEETLSDIVGDAQVVSNIDNTDMYRVLEAWYEQQIPVWNASVKVGLYDLNSEFDAIDTAGLFLNSSHGIGIDFAQTGLNGPSIFPSTSLAARVEWAPSEQLTLRGAILDAVPNDPGDPNRMKIDLSDGALLVGEVNYVTDNDVRLGAGVWSYTKAFDLLVPTATETRSHSDVGIYAFADAVLYREPGSEGQGLTGFLRAGMADEDMN